MAAIESGAASAQAREQTDRLPDADPTSAKALGTALFSFGRSRRVSDAAAAGEWDPGAPAQSCVGDGSCDACSGMAPMAIADDDERQARRCATGLGLPYVDPTVFEVDPKAVAALPAEIAREHDLMPLCFVGSELVIAVADACNEAVAHALALNLNVPFEFVLATPDRIDRAIARYYGPSDDSDVVEEFERLHGRDALAQSPAGREADLGREKPVVRLVHNILCDAIQQRASDVHLRPHESSTELLYRLDGALVHMRNFPKSVLPAVVSRIKILGNMDIAEHRVSQDGRIRMRRNDQVVDMRLSVIPTVKGESVVIRLLDPRGGLKSLDEIGFDEQDHDRFAELMSRSAGLVLVTGPTGCGKSTTLYAALQEIRKHGVNMITVEDPVEYRLDGVNQIEVNTLAGLTFPRALRHILRHDPDVIMIGEIRDLETARIAVESSLTGHLVLSTLHTNDAASAVTRLLELGIEPYLVNTSLMAVLAQRLVRRNCPICVAPESVDAGIRQVLGVTDDEGFVRGKGCSQCHGTGYHGRRAVYELLMVSDRLRQLVTGGANKAAIEACAVKEGMEPLTQNALALARAGETSLEEVYRVRLS